MDGSLRLRQGLTWRTLGDRVVVLDLDDSVYLSVGGSGAVIWDDLARGATSEQLVTRLTQEYDVSTEVAEGDVHTFLADLKARRLLR